MKTQRFNKFFIGALASILVVSILAFSPMAVRYFNGGVFVNGINDEIQLLVQGNATQTSAAFVVEQSDGTDVFAVANDGTISSSAPAGSGDTTISGFLLVDGQADVVQTTVQGNGTQTSDIFVVEQSDGTNVLDVDNIGTTTLVGPLINSVAALSITDNIFVDGQADVVQTIIQGNATQTSDILVVERSDGTDVLGIANTGNTVVKGTILNSDGAYTIADNAIVDGQADLIQMIVQGNATQTSDTFVVEQSDGTDTLSLANDGTMTMLGSVLNSAGAYTVLDNVLVDGQADVVQATIQGNATQTSDILVVEESDGTDILNVNQIQGIDAGATGDLLEVAATTPVDTTGTNVHNLITCDVTIGDSTGGANAVTCVQIDTIVEDAQVVETAINVGDEWDVALDATSPIIATAQTWFDDFMGSTVLAVYTEISGTDGQALQTIVEEQFGVYQLTSGDVGSNVAADGEGVYLSLNYQADQGSLVFETRLHLDTDVATVDLCVGFTDDVSTVEIAFTNAADTVTAVADDAVMFCYDTNATTDEWWVNGAAAGTEATGIAATGVVPVADIYQTLRIEIDDGGSDCRFYIDKVLVGTLTANCVTNTDLLAPGAIISSGGAAVSNILDIDYIYASAGRD